MARGLSGQDKKGHLGPVALVTGGSRGLGKEIALALAKGGHRVVVNYRSSQDEAAEVAGKAGNGAIAVRADVRDLRQVEDMASEIRDTFGRLDVAVNNAGITRDRLLLRQTEAEWDEVMSTNLRGCFNVIKTMAPLMISAGGGHIVNISSYSGVKGKAGQAAYSASKAALLGLTYASARELAGYNIKVNAVLPGYMMTEMGAKAGQAMEKAMTDSIIRTLSSPADVASFVVAILGTGGVTGQVFSLDSRIL